MSFVQLVLQLFCPSPPTIHLDLFTKELHKTLSYLFNACSGDLKISVYIYFKDDIKGTGKPALRVNSQPLAASSYLSSEALPPFSYFKSPSSFIKTHLAFTHQTQSLFFPVLTLVCSVILSYMPLRHHDVLLLCGLADQLMLRTPHYIKNTSAQCALYL